MSVVLDRFRVENIEPEVDLAERLGLFDLDQVECHNPNEEARIRAAIARVSNDRFRSRVISIGRSLAGNTMIKRSSILRVLLRRVSFNERSLPPEYFGPMPPLPLCRGGLGPGRRRSSLGMIWGDSQMMVPARFNVSIATRVTTRATQKLDDMATAFSWLKPHRALEQVCPERHPMVAAEQSSGGLCCRCLTFVSRYSEVLECEQCLWWICLPCAGASELAEVSPEAASEENPEASLPLSYAGSTRNLRRSGTDFSQASEGSLQGPYNSSGAEHSNRLRSNSFASYGSSDGTADKVDHAMPHLSLLVDQAAASSQPAFQDCELKI